MKPTSHEELLHAIQHIYDKQTQYAARHDWRVGAWVSLAAAKAHPHLEDVTKQVNVLAALEIAVQRIYAERERFRREHEDPDGYGSATLSEMARDVSMLADRYRE